MKKSVVLASAVAACSIVASADTYDNGPLITHPGAGFAGADASVMQTNLGLTVFGFGNNAGIGLRVADNFIVPKGQVWKVSAFTFFTYQTGANTTSPTITNINLGLWSKKPDGKPGTGDVLPNANFPVNASNAKWTSIYRVTDTAMLGTTRPIWKITIALPTPISLDAGDYWIDWSAAGTLAAGPWVPPVSILDKTNKPFANALQFLPLAAGGTDQWLPIIDSAFAMAPQDLPFIITLSDCYADCDADGQLTIDDFICYQSHFAISDPYADCDSDGFFTIDDFICFQILYALGC